MNAKCSHRSLSLQDSVEEVFLYHGSFFGQATLVVVWQVFLPLRKEPNLIASPATFMTLHSLERICHSCFKLEELFSLETILSKSPQRDVYGFVSS